MELLIPHSPLSCLLSHLGTEKLSFPHPVDDLKVVQTHISIVLLAGPFAYKIKKPVHFPFVDYSTLEKRRNFCRLELDLNRRLTEDLYLEVVPLTRNGNILEVGGKGVPVEYAVKMKRLPDDRRLGQILRSGNLPQGFWEKLAYLLVRFYRNAAQGPEVSRWAQVKAVEEDLREIFQQIREFPAKVLHPVLRQRLEFLATRSLEAQKGRIEKRAPLAREGHGDLRLEHIYYFPRESEPRDIALIDCVEFNPRYRCCDPLADIAFLLMDLEAGGFGAEAQRFKQVFHTVSGEVEDGLMDYYVAYRHLVRGLVRGLQCLDKEAGSEESEEPRDKARLHFLKALSKLDEPGGRPCLVLLSGLPAAGKSTLAEQLVLSENFQTFSSDATRKELAGRSLESEPAIGYQKGLYKPEWTEKTYSALLERAATALRRGQRVLVDASFSRQAWRERFQNLAKELGVPFLLFACTIGHDKARQRLSEGRHFGSDANLEIYGKMAEHWERPTPELGTLFLNTERPLGVNLSEIQLILEEKGLSKIGSQLEKTSE